MRNIILKTICIIFLGSIAAAQTYTEIFEGGWVSGMNCSRPVFVDLDKDDCLDMLVGNWIGSINHFEQDTPGSTTFNLITEHFNEINYIKFNSPCIADIDNDDLLDLIIGESDGNLHHYEQETVGSETFTYVTDSFNDINVGGYSKPSFTDLDQDGLLDLIIGEDYGSLYHYEQDASDLNIFNLVSDSLSDINVGRGADPCIIDIDNNGLLDLIIGEIDGNLNHYEQDVAGGNNFIFISDTLNEIDVGRWSAPCFTDLDNDDRYDLIVGEASGNFYHYEQNAAGSCVFDLISAKFITGLIDVGQYSAPHFMDLDNNGLLDMIIGEYDGNLNYFQQDSPGSNSFTLISENFNGIHIGIFATLACIDLDKDNLLDLIVGEWSGNLNHYEQDSINSTTFSLITDSFNDINVGSGATPHFIDLDNDSLLDLIIGELDGNLNHYEQNDTGAYSFTLITENLCDIDVGRRSAPCFTDLDNNSLLDLIVGTSSGDLYHYEQDDIGGTSFTLKTQDFAGISITDGARPVFADINGDGLEDLIVGNTDGGVRYFQRNADTNIEEHQVNSSSYNLLPNYPNPFNPLTTIQYHLPKSTKVNISIFNMVGQRVKILENRYQQAGPYTVQWNGKDEKGYSLTSGIYILRLQAGEYRKSQKLILVR